MKALAFSLISVSFMSLVLTACGKDDDEETPAATSAYTFSDVDEILLSDCATSGCHNTGSSNKGLTTLAEVKAMGAGKMSRRIQATDSTVMPQNDQSYKNSAEAKKLLDWLAGGADLQ